MANKTVTAPAKVVHVPSNAENALPMSELGARDREDILHLYLETLFRNMREDLDTATQPLESGSSAALAAMDAFNQLAMAEEYVAELKRIGDRPIAGAAKAH